MFLKDKFCSKHLTKLICNLKFFAVEKGEQARVGLVMLIKGFGEKQVSDVQKHLIANGVIADVVLKSLTKFGKITTRNRNDALIFAYQDLMKGRL